MIEHHRIMYVSRGGSEEPLSPLKQLVRSAEGHKTKPLFRRVVNEQVHECPSKEFKDHLYKWENTNQLLKEGYSGIKTGITPSAGPCLSACTKKDGYNVVVVVLSCCSMESRWYEVPKLVNWGVKKIIKIN